MTRTRVSQLGVVTNQNASGGPALDYSPQSVQQFGQVPPGYVWTGSFHAIIPTSLPQMPLNPGQVTPKSMNYILEDVVFTLYRNGQAEHSWTGNGMLCDVQGFGNDQFTVIIENFPFYFGDNAIPAIGSTPPPPTNQISILFDGYQEDEGSATIKVPYISSSNRQSDNYGANDVFQNAILGQTAGNTGHLIPALAGTTALTKRVWSLALTVAGGGNAGILWTPHISQSITTTAHWLGCDIAIIPAASTNQAVANSVSINPQGDYLIATEGLDLVTPAGISGDSLIASASAVWTYLPWR